MQELLHDKPCNRLCMGNERYLQEFCQDKKGSSSCCWWDSCSSGGGALHRLFKGDTQDPYLLLARRRLASEDISVHPGVLEVPDHLCLTMAYSLTLPLIKALRYLMWHFMSALLALQFSTLAVSKCHLQQTTRNSSWCKAAMHSDKVQLIRAPTIINVSLVFRRSVKTF